MSFRTPLTMRDAFFLDPFFSPTWTDFDRIHRDLLSEAHNFWNNAQHQEEQAKQRLEHKKGEANKEAKDNKEKEGESRAVANPFLPRRGWMLPRFLLHDNDDVFGQMVPAINDHQLIHVTNDDSKFEVSLDTHDYKPEDIHVEIKDNQLHVSAKHEEKSDHGFISRQFSRTLTLPKECNAKDVVSNLSKDGVLLVTAPKKALEYGGTKIPVKMQE